MASRGNAISAYIAPFNPKFSAYIYGKNMKAAFLSGTLVSGGVVTAIAHGLGAAPKFISVHAMPTKAQAVSGQREVFLMQAASATTSTNFYIMSTAVTNQAMKYNAFVILN